GRQLLESTGGLAHVPLAARNLAPELRLKDTLDIVMTQIRAGLALLGAHPWICEHETRDPRVAVRVEKCGRRGVAESPDHDLPHGRHCGEEAVERAGDIELDLLEIPRVARAVSHAAIIE